MSRWGGLLGLGGIVVLVVHGAGCITPTSSSSLVDPFQYWDEAQYRIDYWLGWHSACNDANVLRPYHKPVINRVLPAAIPTCDYNADTNTIRYNPSVLDGCMAHELGHAALYQAGNPCWRDFEHDL
jgi:hypothetical protein